MTDPRDYSKKIITIPNVLSLIRLLLIPLIIWLYCSENNYAATTLVLLISGLTDIVDGVIARRFNMISDFGKAFDPIADKLTQLAMLICLLTRFELMWVPLILLVIKEVSTAITGLVAIKRTGIVMGAVWHGKATTVALYTMMMIHLVWYNIPDYASAVLIGMCVAIMLFSFVMYSIRNISAALKK